MASVTTPLVNPFKNYASPVSRTSFFPCYNFKPHFPFIRLSISSTWVSQKSKNSPYRVVPLVAQTSDWAQQDEEKENDKDGLAREGAEDIEGNGAGAASFEGESENEENVESEELSDYEPPEEARLFVGNLAYNVDSEQLAQIFDQAGVVEIAEVIYNRDTDQSRGFGFVTMSTVEEAEKAVEMFNRYDVNGRLLTVNKASPRGSRSERPPRSLEPSFKAFVVNLPWQVDDARLEQVFSQHGNVVEAKVIYERESGRSRGFGFVTMSTESELNAAIAALDGQDLDGRTIGVSVADERPRRSFF